MEDTEKRELNTENGKGRQIKAGNEDREGRQGRKTERGGKGRQGREEG